MKSLILLTVLWGFGLAHADPIYFGSGSMAWSTTVPNERLSAPDFDGADIARRGVQKVVQNLIGPEVKSAGRIDGHWMTVPAEGGPDVSQIVANAQVSYLSNYWSQLTLARADKITLILRRPGQVEPLSTWELLDQLEFSVDDFGLNYLKIRDTTLALHLASVAPIAPHYRVSLEFSGRDDESRPVQTALEFTSLKAFLRFLDIRSAQSDCSLVLLGAAT